MLAFWSSEIPVRAVTFAGSPSSRFVGSALQTVLHPCKKTKDQAESAAARMQSGQGARLPQTFLLTNAKCHVSDLPSCLKPQPSSGWPTE